MSDKPSSLTVVETGDPGLMSRAYNLGLKAVSNLPHVLRVSDLLFWEKNVSLLKAALGGFQCKEEKVLPKLERMINSVSSAICDKVRTLSYEFKKGKITEIEFRDKIDFDLEVLLNTIRASSKMSERIFTKKISAQQIKALKYLISITKDGAVLSKRLVMLLLDRSEGLTKEVCITLQDSREGYTADEITEAARGFDALTSSTGVTFFDQIICAAGSEFRIGMHYGDFDPTRKEKPFSNAGQFSGMPSSMLGKNFDPEIVREGMPLRYTFWLSKENYSRKASLVIATREELEQINLIHWLDIPKV